VSQVVRKERGVDVAKDHDVARGPEGADWRVQRPVGTTLGCRGERSYDRTYDTGTDFANG